MNGGNRRHSLRSFKLKRLPDTISQKSFVPQPVLRIPRLSKASLKRWSEAHVAYLGPSYPYVQEPKRRHSRRVTKTKSIRDMIDRTSIGIETDELGAVEYSDEAIQTMPSPSPPLSNDVQELKNPSPDPSDHVPVDRCDQATATETEIPPEINERVEPCEFFSRLHDQMKRSWMQRKLLSFILFVYVVIMFGLLIILLILLSVYYSQSHSFSNQAPFEEYPLIFGQNRTTTGYNDLHALCTKDSDCQTHMLCSGMADGKRRCHCQNLFEYDPQEKRCRGEYQALCGKNNDCRTSLVCRRTNTTGICTCPPKYQYDPIKTLCRGLSGAICQERSDGCVDEAECRNGICECAHQFIADHKDLCVDPCPKVAMNPVKIRYPGHCRRFIDCQRRIKMECPEATTFNFRTQLCDYRKNILDCQ